MFFGELQNPKHGFHLNCFHKWQRWQNRCSELQDLNATNKKIEWTFLCFFISSVKKFEKVDDEIRFRWFLSLIITGADLFLCVSKDNFSVLLKMVLYKSSCYIVALWRWLMRSIYSYVNKMKITVFLQYCTWHVTKLTIVELSFMILKFNSSLSRYTWRLIHRCTVNANKLFNCSILSIV